MHGNPSTQVEDVAQLPPCDVGAEMGLLASVLMDAGAAVAIAPKIVPADFYAGPHRSIAEAIRAVDAGGSVPDAVTVRSELTRRGTWEDTREALTNLAGAVATPGNAGSYLATVTEKAAARRALEAMSCGVQALRDGEPTAQVLARTRPALDAIGADRGSAVDIMGEPLTVEEVLAKAGDRTRWLVHGYLPENAVVMLSGASGVGKSYILSYLLACGERGQPFLTHPTERFEALWYSEEPEAFLAEKIRMFDLRSVAYYTRGSLDAAPGWPELVARGAERAREMGKRVLIFDPFPTWARHAGDAEQSSGAMTQALGPCLAAAKEGLVVILTHHDTRAGNPFRGSGAIKGALDVGLWLRLLDPLDPEGPRVLSVEKKRPVDCAGVATVALRDGHFQLLGDPLAAKAAQHKEAAIRLLRESEPEGLSGRALASALGVRQDVARRVGEQVGRLEGKGSRSRWHAKEPS